MLIVLNIKYPVSVQIFNLLKMSFLVLGLYRFLHLTFILYKFFNEETESFVLEFLNQF